MDDYITTNFKTLKKQNTESLFYKCYFEHQGSCSMENVFLLKKLITTLKQL